MKRSSLVRRFATGRSRLEDVKHRRTIAEARNAKAEVKGDAAKEMKAFFRTILLSKHESRPADMDDTEFAKRQAFFKEYSLFNRRKINDVESRLAEVCAFQKLSVEAIPLKHLREAALKPVHPLTFPMHRIADARYWTPPLTTSEHSSQNAPKRRVSVVSDIEEGAWAKKTHSLKGLFDRSEDNS